MNYLILFSAIFITAVTACENKEQVSAKIFERKVITKNRLQLKFEYTVDKKRYTDSAIVKNVIISSDSIKVLLNTSNPAAAIPDLQGLE